MFDLTYFNENKTILRDWHAGEVEVAPLIYKTKVYNGFFMDVDGNIYTSRHPSLTWSKGKVVLKCNHNYGNGYPCVMYKDSNTNINHRLRVHIAVASMFLPIDRLSFVKGVPSAILNAAKHDKESLMFLYNSCQVNHIDHDIENYNKNNLEWCTGNENINEYHRHAGFRRAA